MSWFWLALASAFSLATADYLTKRHFSRLPLEQVVILRVIGMLPVSLAILLLVPWPRVEPGFWWAVALAMPAELLAVLTYLKAITASPLALSQPFLAFTPLFVLLSGYLILGELPTWAGVLGIVMLVAGAYGLNLHLARKGWAAPLMAVGREKGSWLMLLTSAIYAYTGVMGKKAILHASPWFMAGVYPLAFAVLLACALAMRGGLGWQWIKKPVAALAVNVCVASMLITHYFAIEMAPAAYMLAVKRLSVMFAVVYGGVLLKEARLVQHLLAAGLMVAGAVAILLFG